MLASYSGKLQVKDAGKLDQAGNTQVDAATLDLGDMALWRAYEFA
jgi:hypothetical protein